MKIDNSVQRHFLIRFLEISGLKGANIDVSTSYLLQASPTVKTNTTTCLPMPTPFFWCADLCIVE